MSIVFRMRGLMGDATEDMVNSLESENGELAGFRSLCFCVSQ